ncbi:MAG: hypothetical protein JRJ58_19760, partial [Deltaproteobacteria bacterium]|nr:hypothetical protein [Deltaproteobacteria bacterium]
MINDIAWLSSRVPLLLGCTSLLLSLLSIAPVCAFAQQAEAASDTSNPADASTDATTDTVADTSSAADPSVTQDSE